MSSLPLSQRILQWHADAHLSRGRDHRARAAPGTSGNGVKGWLVKADFCCDAVRDAYICSAGNKLTYRYSHTR